MARKNYETFDLSSNGMEGTQYESIPYGYTVSPTCPPDGGLFEDDGKTFPPTMGEPFAAFNRNATHDDGYQPTVTSNAPSSEVGKTEIADEVKIGDEKVRPVVGWLVGIKGVCRGKDFRLHNERNYIGRKEGLDVVLNDNKISREPAVQVVYDSRSRCFYIAPCDGSQNNSYLNDRLLMMTCELKAYDRLQLGECELVFVPLCGEYFSWDEAAE